MTEQYASNPQYQAFESELLPKLRAGDKASFNRLVEAYYATMLTVARAIVGEVIADEVVQEAWVSIFRSIANFEGRSSLKTWILRITVNQAKTRLRKESRLLSLEALNDGHSELLAGRFNPNGHWSVPPTAWHDESPDALLTHREMGDCIELTFASLPQLQQAVFNLKELEGHSFDEICNILDISASNARVLLHRARIRLYDKIDHFQESGEC